MQGLGAPSQPHQSKWKYNPWKALSRSLRSPSSHERDDSDVPVQCAKIFEEDSKALAMMIKSSGLMAQVKALIIEWRNLPINSHTLSLLRNIPSSHSSHICVLTLTCNLNKLRSLLPLLQAPHLEELNLEFEWEDPRRWDTHLAKENEAVLVDVLAPYIKSHASTLCSLRIVSQAIGDHSPFFSALSTLPRLNLLVLEIPFSKDRLVDPQSLVDFLRSNTSSLKHLELMAQREWRRDRQAEVDLNLVKLSEELIRMDRWLSNLQSFGMSAPAELSNRGLTESLLNRIPSTITSVRLAYRNYTPSELQSIVSIISSRATVFYYLIIDIEKIPPPEVLKDMSIKLPRLWSLTFVIPEDDNYFLPLYHDFARGGSRIEWNLSDLGVYYKWYWKRGDFLQGSLNPEKYPLEGQVYSRSTASEGFEGAMYSILSCLEEVIWRGKDGKGGVKTFNGRRHLRRHGKRRMVPHNHSLILQT